MGLHHLPIFLCQFSYFIKQVRMEREKDGREVNREEDETERKKERTISTSAIVLGHPLPLNEHTLQRESESEVLCNSHSMSILLHWVWNRSVTLAFNKTYFSRGKKMAQVYKPTPLAGSKLKKIWFVSIPIEKLVVLGYILLTVFSNRASC